MIHVRYTTNDDGIWVECDRCRWQAQVPGHEFWPTPHSLVELAHQHECPEDQ